MIIVNRNLAMLIVPILLLGLSAVTSTITSGPTIVKVDPSLIEYHEDATDQQFTVAIKIVDVTNLYGFDIKFRWNTTYLEYVSHSVRVPRNTYLDGVLWNPIIPIMDEVNITAGTYWIAITSRWPAPSFNGSGTVFTMTFRVKYHPVQPEPTANITLELYSTDLSDNSANPIPHTRQNGTVILYALTARHDVAVTDVKPWKTVVGQKYSTNINVTAANQGDYTETFTVTVYANTTEIETRELTLSNGTSATITFTWNTTGFAKGNYMIWAYATPVPGETDTLDNTFTAGLVYVVIPGDIHTDGMVDIYDLILVASAFGSTADETAYNPNADINNDGTIDIYDLIIVASNFGETDP